VKKVSNLFVLFLITICTLFLGCATQYSEPNDVSGSPRFHNVIVLIPDGCGVAHMTIARWFKGTQLTQDSMDISLVRTFSANSMITGSAAAATAFATGYKTWEDSRKARCLSMRPDSQLLPHAKELFPSERWRPVATVLEGARLAGKSVGLVATCRMSHATPAAFASHWHSRYDDNIIMEQMVYQGIDVLFGGGFGYLIPDTQDNGERQDNENLNRVLLSNGYKIIGTKDELFEVESSTPRVWGLFANGHMVHDIDRRFLATDEPSIAEMTKKAIELLSRNPKGFFLMVEGSQVDWSSHDNDPVGVITDYIAFDQAVRVALDFAKSLPGQRTLVLVFPDHDNGGMSLGRRGLYSYGFNPEDMSSIVKKAFLTAEGVEQFIFRSVEKSGPNADSIRNIITQYYGIADLTDEEIEAILAELKVMDVRNLRRVIGPMLSARAGIGWTTFDHTGNDVPMFSYGLSRTPQLIDNTDIAYLCANAMGFRLNDVTQRLFVEARTIFGDAILTIDTAGVMLSKGHLTVRKEERQAVFPFFKNIMIVDQDTVQLEGITVYSLYAHKVFLPRQAAKLFDEYYRDNM
jgi:alkaline phosphatase